MTPNWWPRALRIAMAGATCSCAASPDPSQTNVVATPDFAEFMGDAVEQGVHAFVERRCGTLDCHGQTGRPFRLFSSGGLRLENDAGYVSGIGGDTTLEVYANYESIVTLQPEETSRVVGGVDPPTTLLVVAKPLLVQTHKGGQVLARGDPGDVCLEGWLTGAFSAQSCADAAGIP